MPQTVVSVTEPQVYLDTAMASTPATGTTRQIGASDDLQAALNAMAEGDILLLSPGVTWTGNYILPVPQAGVSGNWCWIMTAGSMPLEGARLTIADAAGYNLPKIYTNTVNPALTTTASSACAKWRVMGVEFGADASVGTMGGIVNLGDGSSAQNSLSLVPTDIIIDRCYVHGNSTLDARSGIKLNAARCAVIESSIEQIHSAFDAQAISGTNGPGPFKITNNYVEAAGENIAFGGGDPHITNLVPSDIEVRHNHIYKPLSYKTSSWLVKNCFETKNSQRMLVEGNVIENSWRSSQSGWAFVLWSANQDGTAPWSVVQDVTIRHNHLLNLASGLSITDHPDYSIFQPVNITTNRIAYHNNVHVGTNAIGEDGVGKVWQVLGSCNNVSIEHNTGFTTSNALFTFDSPNKCNNLVIRNNVGAGAYGLFSPVGTHENAWNATAGTDCQLLGNVIHQDALTFGNDVAGNAYPTAVADIGLVNTSAAYAADAAITDLALDASSVYKNYGVDGTDPGADMTAIAAATTGVTTGSAGSGTGTVTPPLAVLTTLTLAPSTLTVVAGNTGVLGASAFDQNGAAFTLPTLTGHTSDGTKGTVAVSGSVVTVTGVAAGSTNITVSSDAITSNSVAVTVQAAPAPPPVDIPPPTTPGPVKQHPAHGHGPKIKAIKAATPRLTGEDT